MINIYVDDKVIGVPSSYTVMQACSTIGVDLPRFCYNERLTIVGLVGCV